MLFFGKKAIPPTIGDIFVGLKYASILQEFVVKIGNFFHATIVDLASIFTHARILRCHDRVQMIDGRLQFMQFVPHVINDCGEILPREWRAPAEPRSNTRALLRKKRIQLSLNARNTYVFPRVQYEVFH